MVVITRIWQHRNEPDRIHFIANDRRCYVNRGNALFDVLADEIATLVA